MIALWTSVLLVVLSACNGAIILNGKCPHDQVNLTTKIQNSSFVVLGKTIEKSLDPRSDIMFSVKFQVECIFKGPAIPKYINITDAGQVEGKTYCQDFPFGRHAIAFLERSPSNLNQSDVFIPADFVEIPYANKVTNELLVNICGLHRLSPVSMTNVCPAVSTSPECIQTVSNFSSRVIPGGSQVRLDNIQSKSGRTQTEVDVKNGINSSNPSFLLLLFTCFSYVFN